MVEKPRRMGLERLTLDSDTVTLEEYKRLRGRASDGVHVVVPHKWDEK